MPDGKREYNKIVASKRLSRIKIDSDCPLMQLRTVWCRTAYASSEPLDTKDNRHSFYELHYVISGQLTFYFEGREVVRLEPGHFIIIPPYALHGIRDTGDDTEKFVMGFTLSSRDEFIKGALEKCRAGEVFRDNTNIVTYIALMLENAFHQYAGAKSAINSLAICLMIEFLRCVSPSIQEKSSEKRIFENDKRMENALKYISDNISADISGEDAAAFLNVSLRHLNRITGTNTGLSVKQLINAEKVRYIKELLANHALSLADIAEMTGFSTEYALNRFFKRLEGMPLGMFRRSMEK